MRRWEDSPLSYRTLNRDRHFDAPGPKRILALDGGGLRGILTLGFLDRIETLLRKRHGDSPGFRLCHYFDLIAGTSTGAIIAAALAKGMRVDEVVEHYMSLGRSVFERSWFRKGVLRARYDEGKLMVLGKDTTLGSADLQTGLLIMTKRLDTGSPWPLGNNPRGRYFRAPADADWVSNGDFPLWQVVRASTAAPSYFDPEKITITEVPGRKPVIGEFVDGGVSPFNNPALQAFMYATLNGFHVNWPTGADNLQLVSVGTGSADPSRTPAKLAAAGALKAVLALMDDCAALVQTMMQWMSSSPTARVIDSEIGDLSHDLVAPAPLLTYLRYDIDLVADEIAKLKPALPEKEIESLSAMDEPDNLEILKELGELAGARQVKEEDFAYHFDLPA
jgi:patatin-like phospholipase/acyl hydrolase